MDWVAFENDRKFVLEGLRHGEVDYVEHVSEATEADLFRHLVSRDVLTRLAKTYPTPREKEEVPIWLYLASQISLKLHDAAYNAFPYVLRSGGLITALGPNVGRKAVHPDTADVTLACEGFNDKNTNGRQTPCDQDFLRKFARDTNADRLHALTDGRLAALGLVDPRGLQHAIAHASAGLPADFSAFEPVIAAEAWLRAIADVPPIRWSRMPPGTTPLWPSDIGLPATGRMPGAV